MDLNGVATVLSGVTQVFQNILEYDCHESAISGWFRFHFLASASCYLVLAGILRVVLN